MKRYTVRLHKGPLWNYMEPATQLGFVQFDQYSYLCQFWTRRGAQKHADRLNDGPTGTLLVKAEVHS